MYKVVTTTIEPSIKPEGVIDFYVREKQIRDNMGLENLLNVITKCGHHIDKVLPCVSTGILVIIYTEQI